jgi:tight adherence protein C
MELLNDPLFELGLAVLGVTCALLAAGVFIHAQRIQKVSRRIDDLISNRRRVYMSTPQSRMLKASTIAESLDQIGEVVGRSGLIKYTLDAEEKALLGKAGLGTEVWMVRYSMTRSALGLLGLVVGFFWLQADSLPMTFLNVTAAGGFGFMSLKWLLKSMAESREVEFEKELISLVDVMRLLAGVGMSADQALDVISNQLRDLVPITGKLLFNARPQVQSGVTWLTVLRRINQTYSSQDFRSFVAVLEQIEKYGGAVQEPLKLFAERMVEKDRANSKERMGKLSVKLTGIMVLTTLPALLILTGGPGVISLINNLARL